MSVQYSNGRIVTDGLVLNLNAADPNSYPGSGTTWTDISGNNNIFAGTYYTYPSFSTDRAGCFTFINNGSTVNNIYSSTNNISTYNQTQYTRTAAFNASSFSAAWSPIIQNEIGNNSDMGLTITNGGKLMFRQYTTTADFGVVSTNATLSTNTWYIVTMAVNLPTQFVYFYINGILDSTVAIGAAIGNSTSNNIIVGGCAVDSYAGDRMFKGKIAMVGHYNRILTAQEVLQNYNAQKARFGLK